MTNDSSIEKPMINPTDTYADKLQQVREALEYYSNPSDYVSPFTGGMGKLYFDCGLHAKLALTLLDEIQAQGNPCGWQPIETAPTGTTCLIHYVNRNGKYRTIKAKFIKRFTEENDDSDFAEYNEEKDCYYAPEGWYELIDNWDDYSEVMVNEGKPTHWMPLPVAPNSSKPTP